MARRIITTEKMNEDVTIETSLRPRFLKDYIGQEKIKSTLNIYIEAAKQRGETLDHVLLFGPPGLGKTTLANIIANEMGVDIKTTSGPAIEKPGDIVAVIKGLREGDILFIDEIHRLNRQVEEVLYSAMEDFFIDVVIGTGGTNAKSMHIRLPKFTLIGATTQTGNIAGPLRDRFGHSFRLEYYAPDDIKSIIERSAKLLNTTIEPDAAKLLAERSRLTPRIANRLLKRVRDYADVNGDGIIDKPITEAALKLLEIDELGLDPADRNMLSLMIDRYGSRPVGLSTIAALTGDEASTIEDYYEPYLMQLGMIQRTPKGRVVTEAAKKHLGKA